MDYKTHMGRFTLTRLVSVNCVYAEINGAVHTIRSVYSVKSTIDFCVKILDVRKSYGDEPYSCESTLTGLSRVKELRRGKTGRRRIGVIDSRIDFRV